MKRHTELNSLVALFLSDKICASAPTEIVVAMTGLLSHAVIRSSWHISDGPGEGLTMKILSSGFIHKFVYKNKTHGSKMGAISVYRVRSTEE